MKDSEKETKKIFEFAELNYSKRTDAFLKNKEKITNTNPYSVFRKKPDDAKWVTGLSQSIIDVINKDLKGSELEQYLY